MTYSPEGFDPLTFFDVMPRFRDGSDTPRAYLERCLAVIADREPVVKAWVVLNPSGAREAADASTERYRRGRSISSIDGMPIGIKDLIETKDMPTGHGCAAFAGNHTRRDSAIVRALRDAGAVILGKTVTTEMVTARAMLASMLARSPTCGAWRWKSLGVPAVIPASRACLAHRSYLQRCSRPG